jgi:mRNA interferase RelE/StbE
VASHSLLIKPSALKELQALSPQDRRRIITRIEGLSADPRPHGCEKLPGLEQYRLRQGDYRLIHSVDDEVRAVVIVKIGHRRDVYR